jgi:hypothetical protein
MSIQWSEVVLPLEITHQIFSYLPLADLLTFSTASKTTKELVENYLKQQIDWEKLTMTHPPGALIPLQRYSTLIKTHEEKGGSYKDAFKTLVKIICYLEYRSLPSSFCQTKPSDYLATFQQIKINIDIGLKAFSKYLPLESFNTLNPDGDDIASWMEKPDNQKILKHTYHFNNNKPEVQELSINLPYQKLKQIPWQMKYFSKITTIDFSFNQLDFLPNVLTELAQLYFINLSNNQFTKIPEAVLGYGANSSVEAQLDQKNKREVWLRNNQINKIPKEIIHFENFRLNLFNNTINKVSKKIKFKGCVDHHGFFGNEQTLYTHANVQILVNIGAMVLLSKKKP